MVVEAAQGAGLEVYGGCSVGVGEERGTACVCVVEGGVGVQGDVWGDDVHGIEGRRGAYDKEEQ